MPSRKRLPLEWCRFAGSKGNRTAATARTEVVKMIIEMRTYKTKPSMRSRFLEIFHLKSIPAHREIGMKILFCFIPSKIRTHFSLCEVFLTWPAQDAKSAWFISDRSQREYIAPTPPQYLPPRTACKSNSIRASLTNESDLRCPPPAPPHTFPTSASERSPILPSTVRLHKILLSWVRARPGQENPA